MWFTARKMMKHTHGRIWSEPPEILLFRQHRQCLLPVHCLLEEVIDLVRRGDIRLRCVCSLEWFIIWFAEEFPCRFPSRAPSDFPAMQLSRQSCRTFQIATGRRGKGWTKKWVHYANRILSSTIIYNVFLWRTYSSYSMLFNHISTWVKHSKILYYVYIYIL